MKYRRYDRDYLLVFKKGEQFIDSLTEFAKEEGIVAASFQGLGGALRVEIGYYHLDKKEYEFTTLDEVLEVVSLHGNIALKDGEPLIHAHGVFSDPELSTYGGHIKEMVVGGTCELRLQSYDDEWIRKYDEDTGLHLLDLDESA